MAFKTSHDHDFEACSDMHSKLFHISMDIRRDARAAGENPDWETLQKLKRIRRYLLDQVLSA